MYLDLKITVWSILAGVLAAFILFFILTWRNRSDKTKKKSKSELMLIAVLCIEIVIICFLFLPKSNSDVVKFPSTGTNPNPQTLVESAKTLYSTPFDGLITLSALILIVFLAVASFRNIKREKEIDKAKTEFVSIASHQLRSPLTAISWYTEMILSGDVGEITADQRKYLTEVYHGNRRMIELVNTLLDVSRIELGTVLVKSEPIDIVALAESALLDQKPKIEKKQLVIAVNFDRNIPTVSADPKQIRMIFQNLLSNAVTYTPPNGSIDFKVSWDKKKTILIKVSDTGYGIPKNQQGRIFNKLFRADNVVEKDINGTGLGLYIVKSIVKQYGGKIWFESEESKGTTFYVELPI